jgi:hypothetical protein
VSFRFAHIVALAAVALAAPVAAARPIDPPSQPAGQDLRSPDARDAELGRHAAPPPRPAPAPVPAKAPVRATDHSGDDFPWLEAALVATLAVGSAAGLVRWRFRTATPA